MNYTHSAEFLETAWQIGCTLIKDAIWYKDEKCNWMGYWIEPINGEYVPALRTFGTDLYAGTSGVALFLTALYSERPDPQLLRTIKGAVKQITDNMHHCPDHGFYCGKPGVAAVLIKIGSEICQEDYIRKGIELLESIGTADPKTHETDIISGIAGSIPLLLDVYDQFKIQRLLDMAVEMGEALCNMATREGEYWSWATVPAAKNLTGYSHGAAGISSALLRLYTATGHLRFLEASVKGVNYEQAFFDHHQQNWPDFRESGEGKSSCSHAWCHGAPGIAISRAYAATTTADARYQQQADAALLTTATNLDSLLRNQFKTCNYSLCHGLAGNADILLESGNSHYIALANAVGLAGIANYAKTGTNWPSGLSHYQYPTHGLMMGVAGTGYFYLRLHDRTKHPSVLQPRLF